MQFARFAKDRLRGHKQIILSIRGEPIKVDKGIKDLVLVMNGLPGVETYNIPQVASASRQLHTTSPPDIAEPTENENSFEGLLAKSLELGSRRLILQQKPVTLIRGA
jgi:hypothetical protein